MKKKIQLLLIIMIILFYSIPFFAGIHLEKYINRTYYLKHNLTFPDMDFKPKIFPGGITFTEKITDCSTPMWGFPIARGVEIKILEMSRNGLFIEVKMGIGKEGYFFILLSSKNEREFKKSFKEIFSKNKVEDNPFDCIPKTRRDLIKCYGYPIYKCFEKGKEIWYYNIGFTGTRIEGYHDCWIEIKGDKIISSYGHI